MLIYCHGKQSLCIENQNKMENNTRNYMNKHRFSHELKKKQNTKAQINLRQKQTLNAADQNMTISLKYFILHYYGGKQSFC